MVLLNPGYSIGPAPPVSCTYYQARAWAQTHLSVDNGAAREIQHVPGSICWLNEAPTKNSKFLSMCRKLFLQ